MYSLTHSPDLNYRAIAVIVRIIWDSKLSSRLSALVYAFQCAKSVEDFVCFGHLLRFLVRNTPWVREIETALIFYWGHMVVGRVSLLVWYHWPIHEGCMWFSSASFTRVQCVAVRIWSLQLQCQEIGSFTPSVLRYAVCNGLSIVG